MATPRMNRTGSSNPLGGAGNSWGGVPASSPSTGSGFKSALLGKGLTNIAEDPSLKKKKLSKSSPELTNFGKNVVASKEMYASMSAKARGTKIHNGPLELRKALPARDCTAWVRDDKQYSPYSYFENPGNKPSPKPAKSKGPPALWLPPRAKDPPRKKKKADADELPLGAEAGEDEADNESLYERPKIPGEGLVDRPPWDTEHHVMFSRMNNEVQVGCREYFDKPIRKEGEGVPKVRELYRENDRRVGFNDEPAPFGESRRTLYDTIGPYNRGGCKEQQLPSYWRKIQNWQPFTMDEDPKMSVTQTGRPLEKPADRQALIKALADTPAGEAREFWRGWAQNKAGAGALPPKNKYDQPKGWDNRWNVCPSKGNDEINQRNREYFSVPMGLTGLVTEAPRPRRSPKFIARSASAVDRFKEF